MYDTPSDNHVKLIQVNVTHWSGDLMHRLADDLREIFSLTRATGVRH